jgi:hypothetical protein
VKENMITLGELFIQIEASNVFLNVNTTMCETEDLHTVIPDYYVGSISAPPDQSFESITEDMTEEGCADVVWCVSGGTNVVSDIADLFSDHGFVVKQTDCFIHTVLDADQVIMFDCEQDNMSLSDSGSDRGSGIVSLIDSEFNSDSNSSSDSDSNSNSSDSDSDSNSNSSSDSDSDSNSNSNSDSDSDSNSNSDSNSDSDTILCEIGCVCVNCVSEDD